MLSPYLKKKTNIQYREATHQDSKTKKNWCDRDRIYWRKEFANPHNTKNTFIQAAIFNTQKNCAKQYTTIAERSDYYNVIDALAATGILPKKVRFFGAASKVTNTNNVGCIEKTIGKILHSEVTIALLHRINQILFQENMKFVRKLLNDRKITDPKNFTSTQPISAIHFDLNMVEVEQGILEKYLQETLAQMSKQERVKIIQELNQDINFTGVLRNLLKFIADSQSLKWAKDALGVEKLDFLKRKHREAIGKAIVLSLHQNTFQEYKTHIVNGIIPPERLSEYYRIFAEAIAHQ